MYYIFSNCVLYLLCLTVLRDLAKTLPSLAEETFRTANEFKLNASSLRRWLLYASWAALSTFECYRIPQRRPQWAKERERERVRESESEWAPTSREHKHCEWVELVFLAFGISWVSQSQSFLRWGTLCIRVCMCVHGCSCLCLGLARRCCFLCPLAFAGAAELPTPCSVQYFSWRTASCALCSVLSYRPTDHRVMT